MSEIERTGARQRLLFIDACRNDPAKGSKGAGNTPSFIDFKSAEGVSILFSARLGDKSWEYDDLGHGIYSHYLLEGLGGAAAQDNVITFRGLSDYVVKNVKAESFKRENLQLPYTKGEYIGDFLIANILALLPQLLH